MRARKNPRVASSSRHATAGLPCADALSMIAPRLDSSFSSQVHALAASANTSRPAGPDSIGTCG